MFAQDDRELAAVGLRVDHVAVQVDGVQQG
jgi:hypothetical protein